MAMLLIVILLIYLLYIKSNKLLEGNEILDEKKREVKLMKMANLDNILNNLINVYGESNQDCIGEYSEFSPCDKKCGKTYKYKTYRVKQKAGLFGAQCLEEDGARKKQECGISDDVYPCIIGESCQEDEDCKSGNCDPKTDKCVAKKVCSNTNLNLCNKEQCLDLNNNYNYATREFKYDEVESGIKCKLEDKETENNNNNNSNNINNNDNSKSDKSQLDLSTLTSSDCINSGKYWWLIPNISGEADLLESVGCKLKIPNSVYYEEGSQEFELRKQQYGTPDMEPGLYCKIGYSFCPDTSESPDLLPMCKSESDVQNNNLNSTGVYQNIDPRILESIPGNGDIYCKYKIEDQFNNCSETSEFPNWDYFKNNLNPSEYNEKTTIPIGEICKRCGNGWKIDSYGDCTSCGAQTYNQYKIDESGVYTNINDNIIGRNESCIEYNIDNNYTCSNIGMDCSNYNKETNNDTSTSQTTQETFYSDCCTTCGIYQKYDSASGVCTSCESGKQQMSSGEDCVYCDKGQHRQSGSPDGCVSCDQQIDKTSTSHPITSGILRTQCDASYCTNLDIMNGDCVKKSDLESDTETTNTCENIITNAGAEDPSGNDNILYMCSKFNQGKSNITDEFLRQSGYTTFYDTCCETRCKSGVHARDFDENANEWYCKKCADVCGINGSLEDSLDCECVPYEDDSPWHPPRDTTTFNEWDITGDIDDGVIIIIESARLSDDPRLTQPTLLSIIKSTKNPSPNTEVVSKHSNWNYFFYIIRGGPGGPGVNRGWVVHRGSDYRSVNNNFIMNEQLYQYMTSTNNIYYDIYSSIRNQNDGIISNAINALNDFKSSHGGSIDNTSILLQLFISKRMLCEYCMKGNLKVSILDAKLNVDIHPRNVNSGTENTDGVWFESYNLMRDTETMGEYTIQTTKNKDKICKFCTGQFKDPQAQQTPTPSDVFATSLSIQAPGNTAAAQNDQSTLPQPCNDLADQVSDGTAAANQLNWCRQLMNLPNVNECCSHPPFNTISRFMGSNYDYCNACRFLVR
jgi:hypothetical protein